VRQGRPCVKRAASRHSGAAKADAREARGVEARGVGQGWPRVKRAALRHAGATGAAARGARGVGPRGSDRGGRAWSARRWATRERQGRPRGRPAALRHAGADGGMERRAAEACAVACGVEKGLRKGAGARRRDLLLPKLKKRDPESRATRPPAGQGKNHVPWLLVARVYAIRRMRKGR
jgi:hypothetical protein